MKKKTIYCLLAALGWTAAAGADDFKSGIYSYEFMSPTTVCLTKVTNPVSEWQPIDTTKMEVPQTVEWRGHTLTVTSLGQGSFGGVNADSIVLPNTITSLGDYTFQSNNRLRHINLPAPLQSIGSCCFQWCSNLEEIALPDSLQRIGDGAFANTGLREVKFPAKLTRIDNNAFAGCKQLRELNFPKSLETIGSWAFANCPQIEKITTNGPLATIGEAAFGNCTKLKEVKLGGAVKRLDGFADCPLLEEFTITEGTETLGMSCFSNCKLLKEISIPASVTTIGEYAFHGCSELTRLEIPFGVKRLNDNIIDECTKLEEMVLGANVESLSWQSLKGATALKRIRVERATPPDYWNDSYTQEIIDLFNRAEVIVPTGSKANYEKANFWKNFKTYTEQDMPRKYHYLAIGTGFGGEATCNGQTAKQGSSALLAVPTGENMEIAITPDSAHVVSEIFMYKQGQGGENIVGQMADNKLKIEATSDDIQLQVNFGQATITLDIIQTEQGLVRLEVPKHQGYGYRVLPEEGWTLHSMSLNGADITERSRSGDYCFTPRFTANAVIRLAFEQVPAGIGSTQTDQLRVIGTDEGISIANTTAGEDIRIYSVDGRLIRSIKASGESISLALPSGAVYLIRTEHKTIKIRL